MTDDDLEAADYAKQMQALADAARGDPAGLLTPADVIADIRSITSPNVMAKMASHLRKVSGQPRRSLVFDIETAALPNAAEYLDGFEPPSNYRDPTKIAAYTAVKRQEQLDKAALDPDLCRVVAIGAWDGQSEPYIGTTERDSEAVVIENFWRTMNGIGWHLGKGQVHHLIGYNCLSFDLPVLIRRSQYLGIPVPKLDLSKYRSQEHVTDLMQVLSFQGVQKYRSLNWYAKRFGIDVVDPLTGAQIAQSVRCGLWHEVEAHLAADLKKTAMLASRLGLFAEVK